MPRAPTWLNTALRKVIRKKKHGASEPDRESGCGGSNLTSMPLKVKVIRRVKMMKMKRNKRFMKNHGSLELIKKKLDEGLMVELSSSSDDSEPDDQPKQQATRDEELPSIEAEMREILSEIDNSREPEWPVLSDPDLEGAIIN